jgi:hypothetical protein
MGIKFRRRHWPTCPLRADGQNHSSGASRPSPAQRSHRPHLRRSGRYRSLGETAPDGDLWSCCIEPNADLIFTRVRHCRKVHLWTVELVKSRSWRVERASRHHWRTPLGALTRARATFSLHTISRSRLGTWWTGSDRRSSHSMPIAF